MLKHEKRFFFIVAVAVVCLFLEEVSAYIVLVSVELTM